VRRTAELRHTLIRVKTVETELIAAALRRETDSSDHGGGRLRPDAFDPGDPLTGPIDHEYRIDLLVECGDSAVQS
jgi:hypothetical protein